jgi:hypothetical protein
VRFFVASNSAAAHCDRVPPRKNKKPPPPDAPKQKRLRCRSRFCVDRLRVTNDANDYFFFFGAAFFFAAAFFAAIEFFSLIEICDSEKSQCDSYIELSGKKVKQKNRSTS